MKNTHQMKIVIKLIFLILFTSCKAAKINSPQTPGSPAKTDPNPGETSGSPSEYHWQYAGTIGTGSRGFENNQFDYPHGVALDSSGNIYVADSRNNRIQIFSHSTP